jgi:hypothetical protein
MWLKIYDLTIPTTLNNINQEIFHYGISPFLNYSINSGLSNLFSHFQFLLGEVRKPRCTKTGMDASWTKDKQPQQSGLRGPVRNFTAS